MLGAGEGEGVVWERVFEDFSHAGCDNGNALPNTPPTHAPPRSGDEERGGRFSVGECAMYSGRYGSSEATLLPGGIGKDIKMLGGERSERQRHPEETEKMYGRSGYGKRSLSEGKDRVAGASTDKSEWL